MMAWFENWYQCPDCQCEWQQEWSCICGDSCPACGLRNIEASDFIDLSVRIERALDGSARVYFSPPMAAHKPDYRLFATLPNEALLSFASSLAAQASRPLGP
jgi:hypothetical protein